MKKSVFFLVLIILTVFTVNTAIAGKNCPQKRKVKNAPSRIAKMDKTGSANAAKGKALFQKKAKPMACAMCHGKTGKGDGPAGKSLKPAPRNFTCAATMKKISAGQMFWVIKNGPKGTGAKGMLPFKGLLSDKQIWDVIKYVRTELMK